MKKTTGKKRKIWLVILLSLVIFLGSIGITGIVIFKHYYGMMNIEKEDDIYEEQTWLALEDEELVSDTEALEDAPVTESDETQSGSETPNSEVTSENLENTTAEQTAPIQKEEVTTAETTKVIEVTQETVNPFEGMEATDDIFRILLIGVDSREDNIKGRSDCMILFDINAKTKKIIMTSLLRDIYVNIPGHASNRLNAAYALGGPKLLTQTISNSFGIDVDKYVIINYLMVRDVVDALGGVEVNITKDELEQINNNLNEQNYLLNNQYGTDHLPQSSVGKILLNGNQALAYARIRKVDSDFGRTNRQRNVVTASIEKVKKMSISQINDMLEEFLPRVTTNLTEKDVLTLLLMAVKRKDYSIESMAIPVTGTWQYATIEGKAVIQIDFAANAKAWYDKITGK